MVSNMGTEYPISSAANGPLAAEVAKSMPYFPFKGIERFYDISPVIANPDLFNRLCDVLAAHIKTVGATKIAGVDARGFLFISVAQKLGLPFVMVRKADKMPNCIRSDSYSTEYDSKSGLAIQRNAATKGDKIVVLDDLLATGGTMITAAKLFQQLGAEVVSTVVVVELPIGGRAKMDEAGIPLFSFISNCDLLCTKAELPDDYVDDGEAH